MLLNALLALLNLVILMGKNRPRHNLKAENRKGGENERRINHKWLCHELSTLQFMCVFE